MHIQWNYSKRDGYELWTAINSCVMQNAKGVSLYVEGRKVDGEYHYPRAASNRAEFLYRRKKS